VRTFGITYQLISKDLMAQYRITVSVLIRVYFCSKPSRHLLALSAPVTSSEQTCTNRAVSTRQTRKC